MKDPTRNRVENHPHGGKKPTAVKPHHKDYVGKKEWRASDEWVKVCIYMKWTPEWIDEPTLGE